MNRYLKAFLHRGLIFGGFGPIVMAIVYLVLHLTIDGFSVSGNEVFIAVVSTYVIAFLHAGASVFNQIEGWPLSKSLFCHLAILYLAYSLCYIVNSWIAFEPIALLIFTAVFAVIYFVIWITVFLIVKATEKKLNSCIK